MHLLPKTTRLLSVILFLGAFSGCGTMPKPDDDSKQKIGTELITCDDVHLFFSY
jgi:hypothetical protein